MIVIVDYGAGNLNSVKKAFQHIGADAVVTSEPASLAAADKIVLPGVGHFSALGVLERMGLREAMSQNARAGKPLLGICLGMQWLFDGSEEAPQITGARLFSGTCRQFPLSVKSPHVGWNSLTVQKESRLLQGLMQDTFVYYTHSFHAPVVAATTAASEYGLPFSAAVEQDNIFGVQFHPEKSGPAGLLILKNFCEVR